MKRLSTIILTLLVAGNLQAQDILKRFETERISCIYSYTIPGAIAFNFSGEALVQGNCYYLNGNGLEVFCDGTSRWTIDKDAMEVYIENAEDVQNLLQAFLHNSKNMKYTGNEVTGTFTDPEQETDIDFKLGRIAYTNASEDLSAFTLDVKNLEASYIVTDLR